MTPELSITDQPVKSTNVISEKSGKSGFHGESSARKHLEEFINNMNKTGGAKRNVKGTRKIKKKLDDSYDVISDDVVSDSSVNPFKEVYARRQKKVNDLKQLLYTERMKPEDVQKKEEEFNKVKQNVYDVIMKLAKVDDQKVRFYWAILYKQIRDKNPELKGFENANELLKMLQDEKKFKKSLDAITDNEIEDVKQKIEEKRKVREQVRAEKREKRRSRRQKKRYSKKCKFNRFNTNV